MNLREALLKEHSKTQILKIAAYVGDSEARFAQLMALFFINEYRIAQRASWVVSHCAEQNEKLIAPYLVTMLDNLDQLVHDAAKRNTIRILQDIDLPKLLQGKATHICFGYLMSKTEPVAIKVFAMTVLANIARQEPDIKPELRAIIEDQLPYALPAFVSRGKKILKQL